MQLLLGLGSNVGDRHTMLDQAIRALEPIMTQLRLSKRYETPALLPEGAPKEWDMPFVNMVVAGECSLEPLALLAELRAIEARLGKQKRGHWAPREIDIDILVYGDVVMQNEQLTIPHPEILNRYFVLAPLADVTPELVLQGKTVQEWFAEKFP